MSMQEWFHYGLFFTGAAVLALGIAGLWFAQKGGLRTGLILMAASIPLVFLGFLLMLFAFRKVTGTG